MSYNRIVSSAALASSNPYLASGRAITYEVTRDGHNGFRIEVTVPARGVKASDRAAVIDWLYRYRAAVRAARPNWTGDFRVTDSGYELAVHPAGTLGEVVAHMEDVKKAWQGVLKNGNG